VIVDFIYIYLEDFFKELLGETASAGGAGSLKFVVIAQYIAYINMVFSGCFMKTPVEEKTLSIKHLLVRAGCRLKAYWLGTWLFDFLSYALSASLLMLAIKLAGISFMAGSVVRFFTLYLAFGFAIMFFFYFFSFLFVSQSSLDKYFPLLNNLVFAGPLFVHLALTYVPPACKAFQMLAMIFSPYYVFFLGS